MKRQNQGRKEGDELTPESINLNQKACSSDEVARGKPIQKKS